MGRRIKTNSPDFWKSPKVKRLAGRRGCYIFGMRAGKGVRLTYIGKTVKQTFAKESFALHKTGEHYNPAVNAVEKGTPVMFFVAAPKSKGKPNQRRISDLEEFLIQTAAANGIELTNGKNLDEKDWGIAGVVRSRKGKPSKAAAALRRAMRLHK